MIARGEVIEKGHRINTRGIRTTTKIFILFQWNRYILRELLPQSVLIGYFEWYFSRRCVESTEKRLDAWNLITARNIATTSEIMSCDASVVPMIGNFHNFQKSLKNT